MNGLRYVPKRILSGLQAAERMADSGRGSGIVLQQRHRSKEQMKTALYRNQLGEAVAEDRGTDRTDAGEFGSRRVGAALQVCTTGAGRSPACLPSARARREQADGAWARAVQVNN